MLASFFTKMMRRFYDKEAKYGTAWKTVPLGSLVDALDKARLDRKWIDVANYAAMIDTRIDMWMREDPLRRSVHIDRKNT